MCDMGRVRKERHLSFIQLIFYLTGYLSSIQLLFYLTVLDSSGYYRDEILLLIGQYFLS